MKLRDAEYNVIPESEVDLVNELVDRKWLEKGDQFFWIKLDKHKKLLSSYDLWSPGGVSLLSEIINC